MRTQETRTSSGETFLLGGTQENPQLKQAAGSLHQAGSAAEVASAEAPAVGAECAIKGRQRPPGRQHPNWCLLAGGPLGQQDWLQPSWMQQHRAQEQPRLRSWDW